MNTVENLKRIRSKINTPDLWTKGKYADQRNDVTCYCLLGALYSVCLNELSEKNERKFRNLISNVIKVAYPDRRRHKDIMTDEIIVNFNDHLDTTHNDIMRVLDIAIERAEHGPL